jgi:hypothetical protein
VIRSDRKIAISFNSVSLFPRDRIEAITTDRFFFVKTSGMATI